MIARLLLILSSTFGILFGTGFIFAGVYGLSNTKLVSTMADKIDLSSVPKADKMKKDVVQKIEESGVVQTVARTLLFSGIIIAGTSGLGLLAAMTASTWLLIMYILALGSIMLGFAIVIILLTFSSVIEKPIIEKLVIMQNEKFVSIVSLLDQKAGNGVFVTIAFNLAQLKLGCCGMRNVGDIRASPRWQASPRGLVGLLKMKPGEDPGADFPAGLLMSDEVSILNDALAAAGSKIPDWLRDRIPPGATLPPGIDLPETLPAGVRIPEKFNISSDILNSAEDIRKLFDESLVLQTPVSCCRFKSTELNFNAKEMVSNLVDANCPFMKENGPGMNQETCYKKATGLLMSYSIVIVIAGFFVGCMLSCNLWLAIQILICG